MTRIRDGQGALLRLMMRERSLDKALALAVRAPGILLIVGIATIRSARYRAPARKTRINIAASRRSVPRAALRDTATLAEWIMRLDAQQ